MAYETTEEVGTVDHLLVDVKRSHTIAIAYRPPSLIARKQSVGWQNIVSIGDRILIRTEPTVSEAEIAAAQNMTGLEVWTDGGDLIGTLVDIHVEKETGKVQKYLFSLAHEQGEDEQAGEENETVIAYAIEPQMIISAGRKRLMIAEEDAQRAQANGGENVRSPQTNRAVQAPLPTAMPTDFNQILQQGKTFANKAAQQARERAKQFTEERLAQQDFIEGDSIPDITEQLQAKTEQARGQVKAQVQQQLNKAAERAEKAKEQLDGRLNQSSFGRSLSSSLNQAIDKFKKPSEPNQETIDVDAFEVWEDD